MRSVFAASLIVTVVLAVFGCADRTAYRDAGGNEVTVKTKDGTYKATQDGKQTSVRTADGKEMSIDSDIRIDEATLGVPFYPGSTDSGKSSRLRQGDKEYLSSVRTTTDTIEQIATFYKSKVQPIESESQTTELFMLTSKNGPKQVIVSARRVGNVTTITIASNSL